ncbi:MAG: HigA family addiction module antidote protein [Bacteroidales bacterium]|jgi:addiction module HigA family antidote|nr:HigA family addiction module antidote protein [Bacteroidales bacterium]
MTTHTPFRPVHPSEMLKDELEYRGISQRKFADTLGMSYTVLNEILNCKRPISTNFALAVESSLGIPAYILNNMQAEYNLQTARKDRTFAYQLRKIHKLAVAACFYPTELY